MDLTETGCEYVNWIYLAQNRDQLWALVNMVVNVRMLGTSRLVEQLLAFEEGPCSVEVVS
jgi:hypothetical protein